MNKPTESFSEACCMAPAPHHYYSGFRWGSDAGWQPTPRVSHRVAGISVTNGQPPTKHTCEAASMGKFCL
jgi:hypothetical protein